MKKFLAVVLICQCLFLSLGAHSATWSQEQLAERARVHSYESQKSFEELFQARRNVTRKVGHLTPSFHLGILLNSVSAGFTKGAGYLLPLQIIAPLLGFIYPSNWFALKESKLAYEAEKRFYISSIANNINTVEVLYLDTHKTIMAIEFYEKMLFEIQKVLKLVHDQDDINPVPFTSYAKLDILALRLSSELGVLKQLYWVQIDELGQAIGLKEEDRKSFVLKRLNTLDSKLELIDSDNFKNLALSRAIEINGGKYLSLAAEFAVKKRRWEFLSPSPDIEGAMGYGYKAQIDIAKSERKMLDIQLEEFKERFLSQIDNTPREFEHLKQAVSNSENIKTSAERYFTLARSKIDFTNAMDFKEYTESVIDYMQASAELIDAKHQVLAQESNYRRLLFKGPAYSQLIPTLWMKSPEDKLSKEERKENRRINKAIKNGELTLPAAEFVDTQELY